MPDVLLDGIAINEVLFANGQQAESLFLGGEVLNAMSAQNLIDIGSALGIDPARIRDNVMLPARVFATGKRAKTLVERFDKQKKRLAARLKLCAMPA